MKSLFLYSSLILLVWSCAQEYSLTGGPTDTLMPEVLRSTPDNGSVNFKGNTVVLHFNEFINVQQLNKELIMSPTPPGKIKHKVNGKKLELSWEGDLRPNTTYQIQFGNSIRDFTANNIANNLSFVFSTGAYLDSLSVYGQVKNAQNNSPIANAWVMLYDDSVFQKIPVSKPVFLSKTDGNGNYRIDHIAKGNYALFALKDDNQDYIYNLPTEFFGFHQDLIKIKDSTTQADLKMDMALPLLPQLKSVKELKDKRLEILVDRPYHSDLALYWNDSLIENWCYAGYDSIIWDNTQASLLEKGNQLVLVANDSIRDTLKLKGLKPDYGKPPYLTMKKSQNINPNAPVVFYPEVKCKGLDTTKLFLIHEGDTAFAAMTISEDGFSYSLNNELEGQENYHLLITPGGISSYFGVENTDTLSLRFKTQTNSYFVHLNLLIEGLDFNKSQYILQLFGENGMVAERILSQEMDAVNSFKNITPGKYKLKIIEDLDRNGYYSPSVPTELIPSEKVLYYPELIEMKKSWDQELNWKIDWE